MRSILEVGSEQLRENKNGDVIRVVSCTTSSFCEESVKVRVCVLNGQCDDTGNQHITKGCASGNHNNQHQTSHQPFLHCEEETGNKNHQQKYNQRYSNYLNVRLQNRVNLHVYLCILSDTGRIDQRNSVLLQIYKMDCYIIYFSGIIKTEKLLDW